MDFFYKRSNEHVKINAMAASVLVSAPKCKMKKKYFYTIRLTLSNAETIQVILTAEKWMEM